MRWVEENIVCPRSELSNEDRVRIYNVTADSYEGHVVEKRCYKAHKMAAETVDKYLKGKVDGRIDA